MLTQEDLQALQTMMETTIDKKLEPINGRLDAIDVRLDTINGRLDAIDVRLDTIDGRLDTIENDMAEVKKSLAEVREATNYLLELVDGKEKAIRKLI